MYKTLFPWAIGITAGSLDEILKAAAIGGFQGVEIPTAEVADIVDSQGADSAMARFSNAGIVPAAWPLPVEWRKSDDEWRSGLAALPRLAKAAQAIGCARVATWVLSGSNDREFAENRRFHIDRFRPIAQILCDHGCSLGLEFIGPKTLIDSFRFPFIRRMQDMLTLGEEIGPNVGLLLDSWHWYTSGATIDELGALTPKQVVYVHVNDAPAGVPVDEQIDNRRALPGETGVIDIASFLQTLAQMGYDGPVTPEPFKSELADLPSDRDRLVAVGTAMDAIFAQAGLTPQTPRL